MTLLALLASQALAAEPVDPFTEPDEAELFRAEERVVTVATRYAQTVAQAPNIVTVLTDREIRTRGYRTLSDLLRSMPGVYVTVAQESRSLAWFRGVTSPDNNKFLLDRSDYVNPSTGPLLQWIRAGGGGTGIYAEFGGSSANPNDAFGASGTFPSIVGEPHTMT